MGRGLGGTQKAVLAALTTPRTTTALAADLARSPRQIRAALTALQRRGLIDIARHQHIASRADGMPVVGNRARLTRPTGRLVTITAAEAVAFVKRWHYTGTAEAGTIRYGWEIDGELVGVTIYSTGTHAVRVGVYGPEHFRHVLHHHRLAMTDTTPRFAESQFIGASLRRLRAERPDIWAIVTYADACQGHQGTIYQATNALFTGVVSKGNLTFIDADGRHQTTQSLPGSWPERRALAAARGWREVRCRGKRRYVYVLGTKVQRRSRPPMRWLVLAYPN